MMNKTGIQSKLLLTAVALLTLGSYTSYGETGIATVTSVKGGGSFDNGGGAEALSVRAEITPGSTITTPPDAEVTLNLTHAGSISLKGGSTLVIERLGYERSGGGQIIDVQLDLRDGSLTGAVNKFSSPLSKYEIKVPSGVVGIDATESNATFYVSAPEDVTIISGSSVFVFTRDGVVRSVRVGSGYSFNPQTGTANPTPEGADIPLPPPTIETIQPKTTPPVYAFQNSVGEQFFIAPTVLVDLFKEEPVLDSNGEPVLDSDKNPTFEYVVDPAWEKLDPALAKLITPVTGVN
jgi:hypothetical protein